MKLSIVALATLLISHLAFAATDIGSRVELFVDEHLIEKKEGAELRLNPPTKREIVLETGQAWEGPVSAYYTVFADGDKVRMYYRGQSYNKKGDAYTCYAESTDGIHFKKPHLGLVEFNGNTQNNILFAGANSASFAPFKDTNPNCKPDERYKALCYEVRNRTGTMTAMTSADGINWRTMKDDSVVPKGSFDSLNTVLWDPAIKKYRCHNRYWDEGDFKGVRAIESRTSDDFVTWSEPAHNVYPPGTPREHFYTSSTVRCPGAEHMWLAFPMRFVPDRKKVSTHSDIGVSDAVLMSSRDAVNWDRPFLQPWVAADLDRENWTERSNMTAWGIITTPGNADEFSMYISEHYRWPSNRLRRLTLPRHRFASVHARKGEVVTKPITFAGETMILNYATSAAGSVIVELQDEAGKPIEGFSEADAQPIYGNELDAAMQWKGGSLAAHAGKPVRVRFILNDADVYAFRFGKKE